MPYMVTQKSTACRTSVSHVTAHGVRAKIGPRDLLTPYIVIREYYLVSLANFWPNFGQCGDTEVNSVEVNF